MNAPRLNFTKQAKRLTPEQAAELRSLGRLDGDWLYLSFKDYWAFRTKVRPTSTLEPRKTELPPLGTMMVNAAHAVARTVKAAVQGGPIWVAPEQQAARWALCEACEHYRPKSGRCALCGCAVKPGMLLRKTQLRAERCPAGKWPE